MKKICIYNWNGVLWEGVHELAKHFEIVEEWKDADIVVLWNEIPGIGWGELVDEAQKAGKKVILYQQGVHGIDRVQYPFNEKIKSDIVCVWGQWDKDHLIKYGTPSEKIFVTGCPILDHLKPRVEHEGKNVVFALEHWDTEDIPENMIVASELRKLDKVNIITKALEREHDLYKYDNVVSSKRYDPDHLDKVADLLSVTDLVVAISESTFAFLAECLDIPVIIADIWIPKTRGGDQRYIDYKHTFTKGVERVKLEDLNKRIMWTLKHPQYLRKERRETAIGYGGESKTPTTDLVNLIKTLC